MYSISSLIKAERHCWKQNSSSHEGTDLDMNIEEGVQAVAGSFWEGWPTTCRVPENKWKYPNCRSIQMFFKLRAQLSRL